MNTDYFDSIPNELIFHMGLTMRPYTLNTYMRLCKRFNEIIGKNGSFWKEKLRIDFGITYDNIDKAYIKYVNMCKPVFVIVNADMCGHCNRFKNTVWPSLQLKLQYEDKVRIVHINLKMRGDPIPSEYHPDLQKIIQWYPTFMLCNGTWENHSKPLQGMIFNGPVTVRGTPTGNKIYSEENLMEWINTTINDVLK